MKHNIREMGLILVRFPDPHCVVLSETGNLTRLILLSKKRIRRIDLLEDWVKELDNVD